MAKVEREITLQPPLLGVSENLAFEQKPPYTTPVSMNMRPYDPDEERARMGQRPGNTKAYPKQLCGIVESDEIAVTIVFDDPDSTVTATEEVFFESMVGKTMVCVTSGNEYTISAFNSATEIEVTGDASGDTGDDITIDDGYPVVKMSAINHTFIIPGT